MLENQIHTLATIIKNKDIQGYLKHSIWDLMQAVFFHDPAAAAQAGYDVKQLIFHTPTVIFWDKMERFLRGTFYSYEDQIKLAEKFNEDNGEYYQYVKKLIYLVDEIDEDEKIDYFAMLTRAFLLTTLERDMYFKLAKIITMCTSFELGYLKELPLNFESENNTWISSLQLYGLFTHKEDDSKIYILSDFGKSLKQNSLNFDEGLKGRQRITGYNQVQPLQDLSPITWKDFEPNLKVEEI